MNNIESAIIDTARKYLGKKEIPQNRGWRDKVLEQAMKLVGWHRGDHWCAFFMELVWKEAYSQVYPGRKDIQKLLGKLCSGNSQRAFRNFSKSGIFKTGAEPKVGAAVIWKYEGSRGHTAAAVVHVGDDFFSSIEGNVSDGVFTRIHRLDEPNRLGFVYPQCFDNY